MLKGDKLPAIVCEAGFSENWDNLMEDTRLWLLCTGGKTKIVFVLYFTEQNSTSGPAADPNLESDTTGESEPANDAARESDPENGTVNESSPTEEEKIINTIDASTCQYDLAQILDQLNKQSKLQKPLIGELTATLHVYHATKDHKDIDEKFKATVLPLPPHNSTQPREFQITLHDIFGEEVPEGMNPEDPITFSLPMLEDIVTNSLEHTAWYRANKLAMRLMKKAGFWKKSETFTQSKRRRLG